MRRSLLHWLTLIALVGAVTASPVGAAHAEAPGGTTPGRPAVRTARLVYVRGVGECPDESTVRNEVLARLGYDPFSEHAPRTVTASIARSPIGLKAHVELDDPASKVAGSRSLESVKSDCSELVSAMVLAISIAIDPTTLIRPSSPSTAAPPPTSSAPRETDAERISPPPAATAERDSLPNAPAAGGLHGVVGALAGAGFGVTPGASFAPRVLIGIESARLAVDIEGRFHLPTEAVAGERAVRASLLLGAIAPCYRVEIVARPALVARACAVLALGRMTGEGSGVDVALTDATAYAAMGPRGAVEVPVARRVALRLSADVLAPLVETRLRLEGANVWSSSPIVMDVALGAVAALP